jgi:cytochrome c peroxidase
MKRPIRVVTRVAGLLALAALALGIYAIAANSAPRQVQLWNWNLPSGFPQPRVPKDNSMSQAKVDVGRRLFYDNRLSGNQQQSCSSCHQQELAFTDGRARSIGSTGMLHPRSAPSLVNVVYAQTLTWANPALTSLERQMEVPLFGTNPVELGVTDANKDAVLQRIRDDRWYAAWFKRAYPGQADPITWTTVMRSIASFERSIVSARSRYDRWLQGKAKLTASEQRGMNLFMGEDAECHHCHGSNLFTDQVVYVGSPNEAPQFHNTGLYNLGGTGAYPSPNEGLFDITGVASDMGKFKAPSLRNVALTAPYMHDGSVKTLSDAVAHYAAGGRDITEGPDAGDGRLNPYKDPLISGIRLSVQDRLDLVAFLRTLTDRALTRDPRFANPFAKPAQG